MKKTQKHIRAVKAAFKGVDRKELARRLGSSVNYVHQLCLGVKSVSPQRARDIEKCTDGAVTRSVLRPDIWEA